MKNFDDLGFVGRVIAPFLAGAGSVFIIWGAIQKDMFVHFVVVTLVIMCFGFCFMNGRPSSAKSGE
jgi:APA family basic amino acid/polyamine antiporter